MEKNIRYEDVRRLFGDIADHKIGEILKSGLPFSEMEKIAVLLAGDTDHIRDFGRLSPEGQDLFNLIRTEQETSEVDRL